MEISGSDGERFIDNRRITGPIPDMLEEAVKFVRRNSRTKTIEDENGHRIDKPEYSMKVVFRHKFITPLLKSGELKMTNPDKPRSLPRNTSDRQIHKMGRYFHDHELTVSDLQKGKHNTTYGSFDSRYHFIFKPNPVFRSSAEYRVVSFLFSFLCVQIHGS